MAKTEQQVILGQRLRAAARSAGISGYRIARRLGLAVPTVYRWWCGQRTPSLAMLRAYAQLVGKPVGYFFDEQESGAAALPQAMGPALLAPAPHGRGQERRDARGGKRPEVPAERAAIGRRMKIAAVQAGLSGSEMARRLGVAPSVVHRWWYGDRKPSSDHLVAYAQLVGKPAEYFYGRAGEPEKLPREMADYLLQWVGRFMTGEEPGTAFDRVTGKPQELTPQERKQLAAAAPRIREALTRAGNGNWELLTEAEQRQVLEQIIRLAAAHRTAS